MRPGDLLEALLELANRAELEVRVLSRTGSGAEFQPTESAACRVGVRIWVVLAPDDPPARQAEVLAGTLARYRRDFLEESYVAPAVRSFIDSSSGAL
jgi:hypothetical protein